MKKGKMIAVRIMLGVAACVSFFQEMGRYPRPTVSEAVTVIASLAILVLPLFFLFIFGTFKPVFYGLGLAVFSLYDAAAELMALGPFMKTSRILGVLNLIEICAAVLLFAASFHFLAKGRLVKGRLKTVFAAVYAAVIPACAIGNRITVERLPNSTPGNTVLSFALSLCIPVLVALATALYSVKRD